MRKCFNERMGSELGFEGFQGAEKNKHSKKERKWRDEIAYIQKDGVTLI